MPTCKLRTLLQFGTTLVLALLTSCGQDADSGPDDEVERQYTQRIFENRGAVCLSPREDALAVNVVFDLCLSSSCNQVDGATCTAVLENDRLVVSSQVTFTSDVTPNRDCTADCGGSVGASCGVIAPPSTSIGVVYGSRRTNMLTLPLVSDTLVHDDGALGDCPSQLDTYFEQ